MTLQKGRDDIPYSLKPGKFTYTQLLYVFSVLRVAGSCRLTVYSLVYSIRYYVPIPMKLASVEHTEPNTDNFIPFYDDLSLPCSLYCTSRKGTLPMLPKTYELKIFLDIAFKAF